MELEESQINDRSQQSSRATPSVQRAGRWQVQIHERASRTQEDKKYCKAHRQLEAHVSSLRRLYVGRLWTFDFVISEMLPRQ